jgi:transposase-like protein
MSRGKRAESGDAEGARRATGAGPDSAGGGKGRWSARRKATVVLELIRGADLETVSRKHGITAATLTGWRDAFLEGGEAGLKSRTVEVSDEKEKTLKSAVTGLVMDNELLKERVRQLEDEKPFLRWRSKQ